MHVPRSLALVYVKFNLNLNSSISRRKVLSNLEEELNLTCWRTSSEFGVFIATKEILFFWPMILAGDITAREAHNLER